MSKEDKDIAGIQSIEVGAAILFALAQIGRRATLNEIASATGMVPAKLHRYLASMMKSGLVVQPKKAGVYALGPGAIRIGLAALQQNDFCTIATQHLGEIRDALDVTCFGAVLGKQGPTIFAQEVAANNVAVFVRVGSVLPMENSSTGWAFGAFMSDSQYRAVCGIERARAPEATLKRHREVKKHGCARITDEYVRGISAISYPVFGLNNAIEGVITALGATGNFDNAVDGLISKKLREVASQIGRSLGANV